MSDLVHGTMPCGIEYGIVPLPARRVVAFQIRVLAGVANEPADKPGLARLLEQTIDKGTQHYTGRQLFDAFDAIGASANSGTGRETTTFTCTILPEHFERAVELHAEMIRRPTFPQESLDVNRDLTIQEIKALEDDPQGLTDMHIGRLAYGTYLGRHSLGTEASIGSISRDDVASHFKKVFTNGRMLVSVAGPVTESQVLDVFSRHFDGFGEPVAAGRETFPVEFTGGITHFEKDLQQQQIAICWPGVDATDDRYATQRVVLGILSGGMSGRLFTEVREKLALVYWVGAWHETPRGSGMMFLGASTTPERCEKTYDTLLREVARLAEDIEEDELDRAKTGILAQRDTRGESTRARCGEIAGDLFFFGRPRTVDEKVDMIRRVGVAEVLDYLANVPRDHRCVVTLGPKAMKKVDTGDTAKA